MKTIVVKWVEETTYGYDKAMRVIISDHERFSAGTRFDFGFFSIATDEGYTIISLPMDEYMVFTRMYGKPCIVWKDKEFSGETYLEAIERAMRNEKDNCI